MNEPIIISVGGGKGGVGKSIIAANIGAVLTQKGFRVGFIDGDLRGANLHLYLGVRRPKLGLNDFLCGRCATLKEVALETVIPGSWLVSGASDILSLANPTFSQKQKIINNLRKLEADFILVDLGAGTDYQVSDFFIAFPYSIVVCDGLPSSVENAYGFLKNGIIRGFMRLFSGNKSLQDRIKKYCDPRRPEGAITIEDILRLLQNEWPGEAKIMRQWLRTKKMFLVLNMVKDPDDVKVGRRFVEIVKQYLGADLLYIGYIIYSTGMRRSARAMTPVVLDNREPRLVDCFNVITRNICALTRG